MADGSICQGLSNICRAVGVGGKYDIVKFTLRRTLFVTVRNQSIFGFGEMV